MLLYSNVKIIQYNAIHKFVGVLDNPQPPQDILMDKSSQEYIILSNMS